MKMFHLLRLEDETGRSGTGVIAEGVMFTDGAVALRWMTEWKSTALFDSIEGIEKTHGHSGKTQIIWREPANGDTS